jgi:hypothetical protein
MTLHFIIGLGNWLDDPMPYHAENRTNPKILKITDSRKESGDC